MPSSSLVHLMITAPYLNTQAAQALIAFNLLFPFIFNLRINYTTAFSYTCFFEKLSFIFFSLILSSSHMFTASRQQPPSSLILVRPCSHEAALKIYRIMYTYIYKLKKYIFRNQQREPISHGTMSAKASTKEAARGKIANLNIKS